MKKIRRKAPVSRRNVFTISEDKEVVLNGKKFLLEKGDRIVLREERSETFGELLNRYKLPPPPGSEQYLDNILWHHEYNHVWYGYKYGDNPSIEFSDFPPNFMTSINHNRWAFVDGQWEKYDRNKEYTYRKSMGGTSDLSRHLSANSPHGLSR